MTNDDLPRLRRELVAANRILAREDVVDAYGHVSMRHPRDPGRYMMSRSRSPALVVDDDLMEFFLDGTPIDADGRIPYGHPCRGDHRRAGAGLGHSQGIWRHRYARADHGTGSFPGSRDRYM